MVQWDEFWRAMDAFHLATEALLESDARFLIEATRQRVAGLQRRALARGTPTSQELKVVTELTRVMNEIRASQREEDRD